MLVKKLFVDEFGADVYTYDVNGLCIIFVDKECDEFVFNATINNKHINNNGLPHMVEHCVFGGSSSYNIDEPFEYAVKTKKYKYLNAITYRDRTVYPFSTYDNNDFDDILDIYLDAIFNANMSKETFEQECVRVDSGEYNGIVLNEMTEMHNDDFYRNECEIFSKLDTNIFKYNSAGEPNAIKTVKYEDVKDYYKDNYTTSNITISFYGKLEHNKYIELVSQKASRLFSSKKFDIIDNSSDNTASEFININDVQLYNKSSIVITSKINNLTAERELDLILRCLILSSEKKIFNMLKETYDVVRVSTSINTDLNIKYLIFDIEYASENEKRVNCKDFVNIIERIAKDYSYEDFNKELYEKIFIYKNKDYGYKTEGIYTLLEISKIGKSVYGYYEQIDYNLATLPLKSKVNINDINFAYVLSGFAQSCIQYNDKKNTITSDSIKDIKKSKKNIHNPFFSSTNYDIMNTIIVINFKKAILPYEIDLNDININENIFKQLNSVMNVYFSRVRLKEIKLDGFYLNLSLFTENKQKCLLTLCEFLENLTFEQVFELSAECNIDYSFKLDDIINFIIKNSNEQILLGNTECFDDEVIKSTSLELEVFLVDSEYSRIVEVEKVQNNNFMCNKKQLVHINNLQKNNNSTKQETKQINQVMQSELYKNFLVLDITNNNNEYCIDYMYLELVLEALVNEKLLTKIRLENGAYEVNFKLLKLENKVVLYSNIDRNSKITLDIFKTELKSLNKDDLGNVENYLNKITNNFYRNEQNKNIKIKKLFDNWLLGVNDTLTSFDYDKVEQAICILKNAEIVGEYSFGKTNYENYKDGGTYVY